MLRSVHGLLKRGAGRGAPQLASHAIKLHTSPSVGQVLEKGLEFDGAAGEASHSLRAALAAPSTARWSYTHAGPALGAGVPIVARESCRRDGG
jgi:hypothetical protein